MRISAKGRYALAALMEISRRSCAGEIVSVVSIAEHLGVSKIFLEQAVSLLKKSGVIRSTKGSKGGYQLVREPEDITVLEALSNIENTLLEKNDHDVLKKAPITDTAIHSALFDKLDKAVEDCLSGITIRDLIDCADRQNDVQSFMLNI
ncbi:MAG: Rrf2 family transcriptional regulator [Clostridiales bacterium]|jgi:Rrf2 family protein|nr:Rrf2 family transcriptional regulator [Clostridiales bacterium]